MINLRPSGFGREQPEAARESHYRFAERITPQHFVPEPEMFGMRKLGGIERPNFQGEQFVLYRRLAA